jgi:hypothetical protein
MHTENVDTIVPCNSIPRLLSAARREYLNRQSYSGPKMQDLTAFFGAIGSELHGTGFLWTDYNKGVWEAYITCPDAYGGAAMFSLEADGNYHDASFKGLFVGGPLGFYPYELEAKPPGLKGLGEIISSKTKYSPEVRLAS